MCPIKAVQCSSWKGSSRIPGTRLGGPSNAQEPSSSGRENDRPSQRTGGEQNSLPSNFSVDPTPIKQQRVLPNGKKVKATAYQELFFQTATVHRLVAPDKNSNYKLTDRETEWPEFTGVTFFTWKLP